MEHWQKRWFENKMPARSKSILDRVLSAKTKNEAEDILTDQAKVLMEHFGFDLRQALKEASTDIGYLLGYASHAERARLEELFDVAHPIFGRLSEKGPPDVVQAFAAGTALGKQKLKEN